MEIDHPMYPPGVRKMAPTKKHVPAIWECMLGTVYASNGKEVRYFDYNWEAAWDFAGVGTSAVADPRTAINTQRYPYGKGPAVGRRALFVLRSE